ncbi:MarR family winged helix-turn-helix transcriptional regulator [Anaeromyxobacter dehalogenans]|uniref:Transcriptional regulator, MarR family n=1 Tax=Anaeromyxobacter dehalogenans (strain 2CP-C) TaxID=290397 RepID=Q2IN20_ANADE|nr:MarR family transcriptional regulator [Anaeromyxobacter dehalogenans]ABC80202.1 transcriptional regulator, MarR family [Anaeromyxobacter dehalogenans 2CP-C]
MRSTPARSGPAADARRVRELLVRLSRHGSLRDPIGGSGHGLDLSPVQVHALLWLGMGGALTMGELARHVAVTEKTITGVVDRLERDELVQRARSRDDRRVVRVSLAARGEAAWRALDAEISARLEGLLALLEPRDRRDLVRILARLDERLRPAADAAPGPARARAARGAGGRQHERREDA